MVETKDMTRECPRRVVSTGAGRVAVGLGRIAGRFVTIRQIRAIRVRLSKELCLNSLTQRLAGPIVSTGSAKYDR